MEPNDTENTAKREALYVEDLATSPPGTMTCVTECSNTSKEGLLVGATRTGRGKISTERASGSSRGADMPRWIASSSSRRRRTWGTRNTVEGWMTPPLMALAFLTLGTPLIHEGRLGKGPAVAPRRYRWAVGRFAFRL